MRFLIGKSVYDVAIEGLGADDTLGWIDGKRLCLVREHGRVERAWGTLLDLCCRAWMQERGGFGAELPTQNAAVQIIERIGAQRSADVIDEFERQFNFSGGLPTLAEMMGLAVTPANMPKIEWAKLSDAEAREAVIRWRLCGHLSDELFTEYRQRYMALGLDPIADECFPDIEFDGKLCVHRVRVIVTLKAKLRIAARTGLFIGAPTIEYLDDEGVVYTEWTKPTPPFAAIATVYRSDQPEPIRRQADWDAYAIYLKDGKTLSKFWDRMPTHMIGKCAVSLALSGAFAECAGLPIREELQPEWGRRGRGTQQQGGASLRDHVEGTVCTLDGDDDAIDANDVAPQGFMAQCRRAMLDAGCPAAAVQAIIDQIREGSGMLEDENPDAFINACVNEVRKRYRRRR